MRIFTLLAINAASVATLIYVCFAPPPAEHPSQLPSIRLADSFRETAVHSAPEVTGSIRRTTGSIVDVPVPTPRPEVLTQLDVSRRIDEAISQLGQTRHPEQIAMAVDKLLKAAGVAPELRENATTQLYGAIDRSRRDAALAATGSKDKEIASLTARLTKALEDIDWWRALAAIITSITGIASAFGICFNAVTTRLNHNLTKLQVAARSRPEALRPRLHAQLADRQPTSALLLSTDTTRGLSDTPPGALPRFLIRANVG